MESRQKDCDRKKLVERLLHLRDHVWIGNQNAMAKAIGLPQGTVSNVLSGKRSPGPKVIKAICSFPGINPVWVQTGAGAPLKNQASFEDNSSVPVADTLLPGTPTSHAALLTLRREQAPATYCRSTIYGVLAGKFLDQAELDANRLCPADVLLIDTDPCLLDQQPSQLTGRLCVVQCAVADLTLQRISVRKIKSMEILVAIQSTASLASGSAPQYRERAIVLGSLSHSAEEDEKQVNDKNTRPIRKLCGVAVCVIRGL